MRMATRLIDETAEIYEFFKFLAGCETRAQTFFREPRKLID